jgi:hypothetical protein
VTRRIRSTLRRGKSVLAAGLSSSRQRGAILLTIGLAVLSVTANLLQLLSAGGAWLWLTVASVLAVALLVLLLLSPILRRNIRGTWLFAALRRTGLIDVEHRADKEHRLPPTEIFHEAGARPVLITGILDQLFQNHREELISFLERGGEVRVLLLHPLRAASSLKRSWVRHHDDWVSYWRTNCDEAEVALGGIIEARLDRYPRFHLRFMVDIPPYFGMLVGSPATEGNGERPFVRVQPLAVSKYVGRGSVVTFEKIPSQIETPFDYYAHDLLAQWEIGVKDQELVEQRRSVLRKASGVRSRRRDDPRA